MAGKVEELADHRRKREPAATGYSGRKQGKDNKSAIGCCPLCGNSTVDQHRPFCSKRCADVDLANWLGGHYRIPLEPTEVHQENDESDGT